MIYIKIHPHQVPFVTWWKSNRLGVHWALGVWVLLRKSKLFLHFYRFLAAKHLDNRKEEQTLELYALEGGLLPTNGPSTTQENLSDFGIILLNFCNIFRFMIVHVIVLLIVWSFLLIYQIFAENDLEVSSSSRTSQWEGFSCWCTVCLDYHNATSCFIPEFIILQKTIYKKYWKLFCLHKMKTTK